MDHIRNTIGQLEMHEKLPTDQRNFDSSSNNEKQLQRISDPGSLPYGGASGERGFDVGNISYKRPSNRKNNEIMSRYDFDESGSTASGPLRSCHNFHKSIKSKCNHTIIIIILGIICLLQLTALICLTVKFGSSDENEPGTRRHSTSNRGRSLTKVMSRNAEPGQVIFNDDFEQFDTKVWRHDQYMTTDGFVLYGSSPNNSYVEDGILHILPTFTIDQFNESYLNYGKLVVGQTIDNRCTSFYRTQCEKIAGGGYRILNPIMSASIRTSQSFAFQYGVLEFRAKMPAGDWISTEISLMPRYEFYGEPADTAKIVLVTTRGNMDYYGPNQTHFGQERFCSQLVYSDSQSSVTSSMIQHCINSEPGDGFGMEFHTYKFDWNPDMLKVFLDDRLVGKFIANTVMPSGVRHIVVPGDLDGEQENSSFNQQFYINMKVGVGVGFPDVGVRARSGITKPWKNDVPEAPYRFWMSRKTWEKSWFNRSAALQVDYIRVRAL